MPPLGKILLRSQHLAAMYAVLTEKIVIPVYELGLPHGTEQLPGRHLVEARQTVEAAQLAATRSHGSRRNHHKFHACAAQLCELVDKGAKPRHVEHAVGSCEDVAAYLYYYSF